MSWSMRTRGNVPRMSTKSPTRMNDLSRNQTMPMSVSKLKAPSGDGPGDEEIGEDEAHDERDDDAPRERSIQTAALSADEDGQHEHRDAQQPRPHRRRIDGKGDWRGDAECLEQRIDVDEPFQPPRKSVTVSAERMKTLTYSAKKKKPKRMPLYSVAKPATISESASVRSKGVRDASAVAAMKKMSAPAAAGRRTSRRCCRPGWPRSCRG